MIEKHVQFQWSEWLNGCSALWFTITKAADTHTYTLNHAHARALVSSMQWPSRSLQFEVSNLFEGYIVLINQNTTAAIPLMHLSHEKDTTHFAPFKWWFDIAYVLIFIIRIGVELVDWLLVNRKSNTRPDAHALCKSLFDRNVLVCVSGVQDFVDGRECYQWKK